MKFKPGGIVILNSIGPRMVMEAPASDGRIVCIWFDGNRLQREVFQPETLRRPRERQGFSTIKLGVWAWGGLTTILAIGCFAIVFFAGLNHVSVVALDLKEMGKNLTETSPNEASFLFSMYLALKDNGTLVGGILGFSGLAWAHFFAVNNRIPAQEGVPEPEPPEGDGRKDAS